MRTNIVVFYIQAVVICLLLVAGPTVSFADGASGSASAGTSTPNMACVPTPRKQAAPPLNQWNDCVGTFTYGDGNVYSGLFRHGQRDGFGVLQIKYRGYSTYGMIGWDEPAIYVGSFGHDQLNDYGLLIVESGKAYAGTFESNILQSDMTPRECVGDVSPDWTDCVGTYRFSNGNVYRGEFAHGVPDGIGMLKVKAAGSPEAGQMSLPSPGVYVGQFKDGKASGRGVVVMKGAGYFGTFRANAFKPGAPVTSQ